MHKRSIIKVFQETRSKVLAKDIASSIKEFNQDQDFCSLEAELLNMIFSECSGVQFETILSTIINILKYQIIDIDSTLSCFGLSNVEKERAKNIISSVSLSTKEYEFSPDLQRRIISLERRVKSIEESLFINNSRHSHHSKFEENTCKQLDDYKILFNSIQNQIKNLHSSIRLQSEYNNGMYIDENNKKFGKKRSGSDISRSSEITDINNLQIIKNETDEFRPSEIPEKPRNLTDNIFHACRDGAIDSVKWLIHNDSKLIEDEYLGLKPFHISCLNGRKDIAEFFISRRVDIDEKDGDGNPSIILATKQGKVEVVDMLLRYGANKNATDATGKTALFWAIIRGHADIFKRLLESGCSISIKDKDGKTPLQWAYDLERMIFVNLLLTNGTVCNKFCIIK